MPPKKHKKGNQTVRGNPAKRIRRPSRRSIEATSAASETSDVHVPRAPASNQTAAERRSTSTWIIYLQHHMSFHSRHRIAKTPVDSLALRVGYQRSKVCSTVWTPQPQVQPLILVRMYCLFKILHLISRVYALSLRTSVLGEPVCWGSHYWGTGAG